MDNWWENFFHGVALDFWRAVISDEQTRAEADFIQKHLQLAAGGNVLDVPCGNGRLTIELARRGFQLTGVDIAAEFIAEAKMKSRAAGVQIHLHERDMRDLPPTAEFDGAFCFGNSFGYLDDQGNADFFKAVSNALRPGARFLLDIGSIAECLLPAFQEQRSFEVGGITLAADSRYDHAQGRMFTEYSFIRDGQTDARPSSQRIYTYHELTGLLREAGFESVDAYSSLSEDAFKLGTQRLLLISEKQKERGEPAFPTQS
jgi:SAM-dependent methyltransferase